MIQLRWVLLLQGIPETLGQYMDFTIWLQFPYKMFGQI